MFNQHKNANTQLLYQREAAFRTQPVAPSAVRLPYTSFGFGRDPRRTTDPSVGNSPLPAPMSCGDAVVQGTIGSILDLRTVGYWLALLYGLPTVHAAVTKQPTNVTGVMVHYANAATPTGNGTLTFTAVGTTLAWKAQGDAVAGAAVNVGAGGRFTLQSDTPNHEIVVHVIAASLPGGNQNDADIAVSATLKAHAFPVNLNDRPSALLELGHLDAGNNKFYRYLGSMLNELSYDVMALEQNISMQLIAGEEVDPLPGAVWDAAPTGYSSVRACGHGGLISDGAAGLGKLTGGTFRVNNAMEGVSLGDGQEGYGLVNQGEMALGGSVKAVFTSGDAYALARANSTTRMLIQSSALSGADTFKLVADMPAVQFIEKTVPKEGKSGLFADLDWTAHRLVSGELPLIYLVSDVPAY
ncbi:MAG: phage tail tube protein [Burkholderiales bacterium]